MSFILIHNDFIIYFLKLQNTRAQLRLEIENHCWCQVTIIQLLFGKPDENIANLTENLNLFRGEKLIFYSFSYNFFIRMGQLSGCSDIVEFSQATKGQQSDKRSR